MRRLDFDRKLWDKIMTFYLRELEGGKKFVHRQKNQLEAYWCRQDGAKQCLFHDPKQRIFARLIKSYQNTTWHQVRLSIPDDNGLGNTNGKRRILITDSWFDNSDIIKTSQNEIESNAFFHDPEHIQKDFVQFCSMAIEVVKNLELKDYRFDQEQNENFDSLRDVISVLFEENCKRRKLKVSEFEKIIYRRLREPYQTIMKMQKLFPGLGVALTCDFLKESHFCNIAKPDIHMSHVFSIIDGFPYSMDLALVKRISEFAEAVCPASPNDFCNSGAYNVDKIIWMLCSDYHIDTDKRKNTGKDRLLEMLTA